MPIDLRPRLRLAAGQLNDIDSLFKPEQTGEPSEMKEDMLCNVDDLADPEIELLQTLVRTNTVNPYCGEEGAPGEKAGQLLLEEAFQAIGAKTRLFEPPEGIYEKVGVLGPEGRCFQGRPNLVAEIDFGAPGKTLLMNGHMDTVGISDMTIEPFSAEIKDGKLWGRGASDCKGNLCAGLTAIKALLPFRDELAGKIIFESVVDEECNGSGAGTLGCCHEGYRGDAALVVDASGLQPIRGCNGVVTAEIDVKGRSGHAARKGGVNAIDKGVVVKDGIDAFKARREQTYPEATVNLGIFHAGVLPAIVPAHARLALNICYLPQEARALEDAGRGWSGRAVREEFERIVLERSSQDEWLREHPPAIKWIKDLIPFDVPETDPLVQLAASCHQQVRGKRPFVTVMPGWNDAAWMSRIFGMPLVLYGCGKEGCAHHAEEHIELNDLIDGTKVMALFIYRFLAR